ncbi:hypothetical protein RF11_05900 [Thelohanellus kitauei]|uniref:Uncharacterized protein n=1 Tax=Thelohanellus kitauei TaxID=669202 RepID=A0A0C2N7A5_THEKT|nr:hypothetical protein RF11_05900 [Thelohanellus kitauei]
MVVQEAMEEVIFICQSRRQTRCRCLQNVGNGAVLDGRTQTSPPIDMETIRHIRRNAVRLLNLPNINDSQDQNDADSTSRTRSESTGVSEHYINYVTDARAHLRRNGICKASCKYLLKYRPCWLKKMSANAQGSRISCSPDQPSKKRQRTPLMPLEVLAEFRCCKKLCSKKIRKNVAYFQKLRDQARQSQKEKRRASRKLLVTPPNEARNCIKFICLAIPINRGTLRNEIRYPTIESNSSPDNREQQAIGEKSRHVATSTCVANNIQVQMA